MPEGNDIKAGNDIRAEGFSVLSDAQKKELMDKIIHGVEKEAKKKYNKEIGYKKVDILKSEELYNKDQERLAKAKNKFERDSALIRQASSWNSDLKSFRSESDRSAEEQKREIDENVKKEAEAMKKRVQQEMQGKQKAIMLAAGDRIDRIAFSIAEKLAAQVEMGGARAFLPIMITYVLAFIKDLSDIITGSIMSIFTGLLFGAIIGYFWILVSGGWHGGVIQKRVIRKILIRLLATSVFESLPIGSFLPTFVVINIWSHMDFRKSVRKAQVELDEVEDQRSRNKDELERALRRVS